MTEYTFDESLDPLPLYLALPAAQPAPVQEPVLSAGPITPEMANWSEADKAELTAVMASHLTTPPAAQPAPVQDAIPKIGCVNHDCDKCKAAAPVQEPVASGSFGHPAHTPQDHWEAWANKPSSAPVQEPVAIPHEWRKVLRKLAFMARTSGGTAGHDSGLSAACDEAEALLSEPYTTPPAAQRPWVGLTDEEGIEIMRQVPHLTIGGLLAVEAKLKEKNNG